MHDSKCPGHPVSESLVKNLPLESNYITDYGSYCALDKSLLSWPIMFNESLASLDGRDAFVKMGGGNADGQAELRLRTYEIMVDSSAHTS